MRILFICGSLEPGKDGVGDYTRRLCGELRKKAHEVAMIGLCDKHVTKVHDTVQRDGTVEIPVLRIPATSAPKVMMTTAMSYITKFDPSYLSLQYVPFGFNDRGLPFGLASKLKKLGEGKHWHIMFHELWVGMDTQAGAKMIAWGWLQRQLIKLTIKRLNPPIIHTQTGLYQQQLSKIGIRSKYLPLFGNIPNLEKRSNGASVDGQFIFIVFGSIHPGSPIEAFAAESAMVLRDNNMSYKVIFTGRCGKELETWTNAFKKHGFDVEIIGAQSPEAISVLLNKATVGISSTPVALSEKSGSVAAMLEHELPVICVSREWIPRGFRESNTALGIGKYEEGNFARWLAQKTLPQTTIGIGFVAEKLIGDFTTVL